MGSPPNRQHLLSASIALLAVAVLATGTGIAQAAGDTVVSIGDKKSGRTAKVSKSGSLSVGDGSGPLTVDGTVKVGGTTAVTGTVDEKLPTPFIVRVSPTTTITTGANCTPAAVPLPAGVPVRIRQVAASLPNTLLSNTPRAQLTLKQKVGGVNVFSQVAIPIDSSTGSGDGAGALDTDLVVKGNTLTAAAEGDVYAIDVCFNRGSAPVGALGVAVVIGER